MPLRKTRGKRQTKRTAAATPNEEEQLPPESEEESVMATKGLGNRQEVQSAIERIKRKYMKREAKREVDIVRVEDENDLEVQRTRHTAVLATDTSSVFEFTAPIEDKENSEQLKDSSIQQPSPKRLETSQPRGKAKSRVSSRLASRGKKKKCDITSTPLATQRLVGVRRSVSSPEFKVPKPPLGHSTPGGAVADAKRRNSYFGFSNLESPLKLSPVKGGSYYESSPSKSPTPEPQSTRPYKKVVDTYDIPLRRPTPAQAKKRKKQTPALDVVDDLKKQFAEVDDFELVVE